ncbi:HK97 family phage prohead protease [Mesorhizobium sp. f-mel]
MRSNGSSLPNISGLFIEKFARGAFDKSLRESPDVVSLWSHDDARPLGRVSNGTLELKSDAIGLFCSLTPNPDSPSGQEALAAVGRGHIGQVSVGFWSEIESWDDRGDLPMRTIEQAGLREISLIVWGAYGDATSASLTRADSRANAARRIHVARAEAAMRIRGLGWCTSFKE